MDDEEGMAAAEDDEMVMSPSDQEMAAVQDHGESEGHSGDKEVASALRPSTTNTVNTAPSSCLQEREPPRATTTATYMYQAPPWSSNAGTTFQTSSQERRSMTTHRSEEIHVARLRTLSMPAGSPSPIYVASAMTGLRIKSSSFRPRALLIPMPISSQAENIRATAATGARHRTRELHSQNRDNHERVQSRLGKEYLPRGQEFVRVNSNIENRSSQHGRKRIPQNHHQIETPHGGEGELLTKTVMSIKLADHFHDPGF